MKSPLTCLLIAIASTFVLTTGLHGNDKVTLTFAARDALEAAVVRIEKAGSKPLGSGVCVSEDGLVVFRNTTDLRALTAIAGETLRLHFSNGQTTTATVTGWSNAWGVAFAAIDRGQWPCVPLADSSLQRAGDFCVAAEFSRAANELSLAEGKITRVEKMWFATNIPMDRFPPIFDADAKLIGVITNKWVGDDADITPASVIAGLIDELATCKNIDRQQATRVDQTLEVDPQIALDPRDMISKTCVQVCTNDNREKNNQWSGVSIGDGLIATCGHHRCAPGTKVTIRFSDGRLVQGTTLGLNPIIDIGLARITDDDDWPAAPMAASSQLLAGAKCFIGGYPAAGTNLVTRETSVVEPEGHVWGELLLTDETGYEFSPGMSGSGIFNEDGFLVAILQGKNPGQPGRHVRIEFLMQNWDSLLLVHP